MTRAEIRLRFRSENPEITERVINDTTLNGWMIDGDKDICAVTKCIISNVPETFVSVKDQQYYNLTGQIPLFFEIDEYPGGGVWYDDEPLVKCTAAEMNYVLRNWKSADAGTPRKYFRRGQYIWFDYAPDTDDVDIDISCVYISNDFDDDSETPFNGLTYLQPYHPGILKYLQWKTKQKIGKDQEAAKAESEYVVFLRRMKKNIQGSQNNSAFFINRSSSGQVHM